MVVHEAQVSASFKKARWDEPDTRSHRAINTGSSTFEEVVTFFLEPPGIDPQPVMP
jgi:hypothetical protein